MKNIVLFIGKSFEVKRPNADQLVVQEGLHINQFLISLFIMVFLVIAAIETKRHGAPNIMLAGPFLTALGLALMGLYYIWKKGRVVFDETKQQVVIKRYQYKFLPAKVIPYAAISRVLIESQDMQSESGKVITKHFFKLLLKPGQKQPLFKVVGDKDARYVKVQMQAHLRFDWKDTHRGITKRPPLFKR